VFFLELLSAVQSRVVDWNMVKKGEDGLYQFHVYVVLASEVSQVLCHLVSWLQRRRRS
jgi:hypothetical protein